MKYCYAFVIHVVPLACVAEHFLQLEQQGLVSGEEHHEAWREQG